MSRTSCLLVRLLPVLALLLAPQAAQGAANATTVSSTQTLDFGTFVVLPTCSNCTITMSAAGARTASAGIVLSSKNVGKVAKFSVGCNNVGCSYTATPGSSVTMAAGGVNMTVGTFTSAKSPATTPSVLSVGAKLTIPNSGSAVGTYTSAIFTITTTP